MESFVSQFLCICLYCSLPNYSEKSARKEKYEGTVTYKYIDSENHGMRYISIDGQPESIHIVMNKHYESIEPGDYIIKRANQLKYLVIKHNDTFVYDYPF